MDGESTSPNGVKTPPDAITLRTHYQQQELALSHMEGNRTESKIQQSQKGKLKTRWNGRWRSNNAPIDTSLKG